MARVKKTTPGRAATPPAGVLDQVITPEYAAYNGDCCEVLPTLPAGSVGLSIHSPPFVGLYHYSSSDRDLSNARSYGEFFDHYEFVVQELTRLTMPGRLAYVHCMDVPTDGANVCGYVDFPGDLIRLYQKLGWEYLPRIVVWKEPLAVRNRTMQKSLAHRQVCEDSTRVCAAAADYLLPFRKKGTNKVPVAHPVGLTSYAGEDQPPAELLKHRGRGGDQKLNRYSHWCWRRYASAVWADIRVGRVLPYQAARDPEDEAHFHPLQLDVIERAVVLGSNPGETVLTPFMGVGSEVYGAVMLGRRGVGIELKSTYYRQAVKNLEAAKGQQAAAGGGEGRSLLDFVAEQ